MDSIRIVSRRLVVVMILFITCLGTSANEMYDSLEISLLTCAPHDEIYSLYGHTAIRVEDKSQGFDMVVNYGLFDSSAPHFVLRFVFGLTDYSMGITSFERFRQEYAYYGSQVTQQTLDLTEEEKARYEKELSVDNTGIMGYIDIPKINISLPVYHGVEENVLQRAVTKGNADGS